MYSNNDKPDKPVKLLYIDKINALGSVINMVKTGESNIGFMIEVVRANWPMSFKNAETIVLEGVIAAKNN